MRTRYNSLIFPHKYNRSSILSDRLHSIEATIQTCTGRVAVGQVFTTLAPVLKQPFFHDRDLAIISNFQARLAARSPR